MRLYGDLAPWFRFLIAPADGADEAAHHERTTLECVPGTPTLRELGASRNGGSHLERRFSCRPAGS